MLKLKKFSVLLALVMLFTTVFASPIMAASNDDVYVVQKGDVLWKIAKEYGTDWQTLAQYNSLKNPNLIFPGQKLNIPKEEKEVAKEEKDVTITVLGTTDMHGNIYDWSYEDNKEDNDVGLAKVYTIVKQVREENPNTLLIDNGDTVQGTILTDDLYNNDLTKPNPMMDVMSFMGYDSMTLGNHEFNFGLELIDKMEKEAKFPILSANIYNKADGTNFAQPYVIKNVGGVKVGILGLTTPNIPQWDGPKVGDLEFKDMALEAQKYAKEMKAKGADIIVATAHSGLEGRDGNIGSQAKRIAEMVPEIETLLVGHDHEDFTKEINGTLVGAASDKAHQVVRFDINLKKDNGTWVVVGKTASLIETKGVEASEEVKEYAKKYHEATQEFLTNVIGQASANFQPENEVKGIAEGYIRDTAVIDLINEVQLKYTGADIAAAALFQTNSDIKAGDVTYSNIFNIYKYPNTLYAVEVTGEELKNYMEWSASYFNTYKPGDVTISFNPEIRGYNYDMFTGVDYKIDISKPAGERIVDLTYKGEPVTDDQTFKLAINNYRYGGLVADGIISGKEYFNSDPKSLRSYIADYIAEKGTIEPTVDNNWEIIGADLDHPLRETIIDMVNNDELAVPTTSDGRTSNAASLNVYELIEAGVIEGYDTLTLLHTNDMHGFFVEGKYDGMGAAKLTAKVNEIKENNKNVLLLDGGDAMQGNNLVTLNKGENAVKIMNAMGYDAMAAGNHEFDYGQERLLELSEMAEFPVLAANVKYEDGTEFLKEYIIKEMDGVKVGIFGLATPETLFKSHPKNSEGLTFNDPVETAKEMVKELEGQVDVIVALAHLGLDDSSVDTSEKLATEVDGIDVIVDGHSHSKLEGGKLVNDTLIVQTQDKTKNLGIVKIALKDGEVVFKDSSLFTKAESADIEEDATIKAIVDEAKAANELIESQVVANSPVLLDGERENVRTGETNLGNLITEAMLAETGADVALTNGGGIRTSIDAGEVTKGEVLQVLPFGNTVQVIEVTGADIVAAIENGVSGYPSAHGAFPHIAGMTVTFDPSKEVGNRVVEVKVGGELLDEAKTYTLATNDFTAAGGDDYTMFVGKDVVGEYNALDQVLIDYINEYGFDKAVTDGRIKAIEDLVSFNIFDLPLAA